MISSPVLSFINRQSNSVSPAPGKGSTRILYVHEKPLGVTAVTVALPIVLATITPLWLTEITSSSELVQARISDAVSGVITYSSCVSVFLRTVTSVFSAEIPVAAL